MLPVDDHGTWPPGAPAEDGGVRRHLARLAASLEATPAELTGLAILLLGGVLCLWVLFWWSRPAPAAPVGPAAGVPTATAEAATVTVHVAGAVVSPGVLELPASARVVDAVAAAGGVTVLADLAGLNLARTVTDGERIVVPPRGGVGAAGEDGVEAGGALGRDGRLDLNRATVAELEALPGIGPVLAKRIVDHREANGPFTSAGQLREVPGIGERIFQGLADHVAVP